MRYTLMLTVWLAIFVLFSAGSGCIEETPSVGRTPPQQLYAVDPDALTDGEKVIVQGLQGILAQGNNAENIWMDYPNGYRLWLEDLGDNHGVTLDYSFQNDPWGLVERFKSRVKGYIIYELGEDSENVATTLAGVAMSLPLSTKLVEEAEEHGLQEVLDVTGKDERWCYENYWAEVNHKVACLQKESIHNALRDYCIAERAFCFSEGKPRFMRKLFHNMDDGGVVLGWGACEESEFVKPASQYDLRVIPADRAQNLSVLSRFQVKSVEQRPGDLQVQAEEDVHYVTFVMSDGDNVQWLLNDFATDERWYGSPLRGDFPMGWTISPGLIELAPTVMERLYDDATDDDSFVSSVSGRGYLYPSQFPDLEREARQLNEYLERTDLSIVSILDTEYGALCRENIRPYADQSNVIGGFWLWYDDYAGHEGDIIFVNGKPFISARYNLWEDKDHPEGKDAPGEIIQALNNAPADPHRIWGYSLVNVHPWSRSMNEVREIVSSLDRDVRVVTPEEFIVQVKRNLSPELFWTFSADAEGWEVGTKPNPSVSDKARWNRHGNPGGSLFMDGSDFRQQETPEEPNSWFSAEVDLPSNAKYLRFQTRASDPEHDGALRVRVKDEDGWDTVMDWRVLSGEEWVTREVDIGNWAGQSVTLRFEQDDNDEGVGEMRYVDNVEIIAQ